jgi:two-component system alkaline phosphatase synthesis response regulator PhoP
LVGENTNTELNKYLFQLVFIHTVVILLLDFIMRSKILYAEDEEAIAEVALLNLELEGYFVEWVKNGEEACNAFQNSLFNLVILDVMMPIKNGYEVCKFIRANNKNIPILFLSAKGETDDRITGLKLGANDYLPKPFNLEEFILRVQALLKTNNVVEVHENKRIGIGEVNFSSFEAFNDRGEKTVLSQKEVGVLKLLLKHEKEVVSRNTIIEEIWGEDSNTTTRTIDNFILNFRKFFEEIPKHPRHFLSIRGVGYKLISG